MADPQTAPRWTRAIFPLAVTPPALTAALLVNGPFDPSMPISSSPPAVVALAFLAAAGPAAAIATSRSAIPDAVERNRVLAIAGLATLAATAATVAVALALAQPLLVRGGGAWILIAAGAAAVPLLAAFAVVEPLARFRWGLLAGECAVALATAFVLGEPRAPDEFLRQVMSEAPGYGASNLGSLLPRRFLPATADHDTRYEARMRAFDAVLARMLENGAFAAPFVEWGDDARVLRAWVQSRAAASPEMSEADAERYLRGAVHERLLFAGSPESRLEPWTRRGVLPKMALAETEGLQTSEDTRIRLHVAMIAVIHLATVLDDRALESEAVALVRKIFADEKLDRAHPVLLATYTLERRRLIEAGDANALLAFLDALAKDEFPDPLRKKFEREAAFLREHDDGDHVPVMMLLQARVLWNGGDGDDKAAREAYRKLLGSWPTSSVVPIARAELQEIGP